MGFDLGSVQSAVSGAISSTAGKIASSGLPSVHIPSVSLPPVVAKVLPPRTISGLIPSQVRDMLKYGSVLAHEIPDALGLPNPFIRQRLNRPLYPNIPTAIRGTLCDAAVTADIMTFQFNPEEIRTPMRHGWAISDQPGRSHPFVQWAGSGQHTISFVLHFYFPDFAGNVGSADDPTKNAPKMASTGVGDVLNTCRWLQSFLYPHYDTSEQIPLAPHALLLTLGQMFIAQKCILLKADPQYNRFDPQTMRPSQASIELELLVISDTLVTAYEYRTGGQPVDATVRSTPLTPVTGPGSGNP